MTIATLLMLAALILFIVAACGVTSRINLVAAGLACAVGATLVPIFA